MNQQYQVSSIRSQTIRILPTQNLSNFPRHIEYLKLYYAYQRSFRCVKYNQEGGRQENPLKIQSN